MRFVVIMFFCFVVVSSVHGHNKVVVVPLLETESPIANVVTVAKQGGDFVSIAQALDSIVGASTSNQYLVQIGPGEYITNRTLHIKPGVTVVGSGIETTRVVGRIVTDSFLESVFSMDNGARLSSLTVEASGSGGKPVAGITASLGGCCEGSTVTNARVHVSGGSSNYGIYSDTFVFNIEGSKILVNGESGIMSYGVIQSTGLDATIRIDNSEIIMSNCNGTNCIGAYTEYEAPIFIRNSRLVMGVIGVDPQVAEGVALSIRFGGHAIIQNSIVLGSISLDRAEGSNLTFYDDSTLRIMNSTVSKGVEGEGAVCLNTNNEVVELSADCSLPQQ